MNRIFFCLLGLPTLVVSMSATGQTTDAAARQSHSLPLLVYGGGYQTRLMVTNVADRANRCTLELLDGRLDASRFETHENLTWRGNSATLELPNPGTRIQISGRNPPQSEVYDSAAIDCDLPAVVRILVTMSANNVVEAAALLPSAQSGAMFGIPALSRFGDYLLAARNGDADEANCSIELLDESGNRVGRRSLTVSGNSTVSEYLSDLAPTPTGFAGGSATVSCDRQITATGMLAGAAWSGLPPTVLSRDPAAAGSNGSGDGEQPPGDGACRAGLVVNPGESCTYKGHDFTVSSSGRGSIAFFSAGTGIDARGSTINGVLWNFHATKNSGSNSWTIHVAESQTGGSQTTTFGTGDTISSLPTGSWTPDVTSGGSFSRSGGNTVIELNNGGYIEEGNYRYTCQSAGGCAIQNRNVQSGTVAQTSAGEAPGDGGTGGGNNQGAADDHGDDRASATRVTVGSDTSGALTAGDTDWFRVDVNSSGKLEVYTSGSLDSVGRLEDAAGSSVDSDDDGGASRNFRLSADVDSGAYYVRVRGFGDDESGSYTLHVRFTPGSGNGEQPPGDGACRAGLVVNPGESCTYKGHDFTVSSSGRGSIAFFSAGTAIDTRGSTINGVLWNFYATKNSGSNSWTIHVAD